MSIVPNSLPAWTRTATPTAYGGHPGKRDQGGIGAVNPKTDVTAPEWLAIASDLAHAVNAAPLMVLRVQYTYSPLAVVVVDCQPQWGDAEGYTTPPTSHYPTVTPSGTSLVISFPGTTASVDGIPWITIPDEYGVNGSFQMSSVDVSSDDSISHGYSLSASGTVLTVTDCTGNGRITLVVY